MRYSGWRIFAEALRGNTGWSPAWRDPHPKPAYDAVIIGGGGHGLATAYYLAKEHGMTNIAVLERGLIGLGNTGRNTTTIRSNYLLPQNHNFYEFSLKQWESLEQEINFNAMVSQRGVLSIFHTDGARNAAARRGNGMHLNGIDAELLDREQVRQFCPLLDVDNGRFPVKGGLLQRRAGTARHDAVAWGYARAADRRGVDIIQHCEVLGIDIEGGRVTGLRTSRGPIKTSRVGLAVAGNTSRLAAMAGISVPMESHVLQAFVSESIKPLVDSVISFGAEHFYITQSDKGGLVFGGALDGWNTYAQRGNLLLVEHVFTAGIAMMPCLSRLRGLRAWGGLMDMTFDGSPIMGKTPIDGLTMSAGWCYGGFKAIPGSGWCHAWTIAKGEPHPLIAAHGLDRFRQGRLLDERGVGPFPWLH